MPSLWAFLFGIIIFSVEGAEITLFLRLLIVVPIFSFIPLLIYWNYKRFPKRIMKKSKLKEFDKKKFPDHFEYIEKLQGEYLSSGKNPTLMYQPFDTSESAFTFGIKNHVSISISGGLIKKFRKNIDGFKSIFLHEIGHITNRDVEKTYLADSTWKSLFLTLSIPFGILLLYIVYLILTIFSLALSSGIGMDYIISEMDIGKSLLIFGVYALYFLIFGGIIYLLRKQIIRLREFYADAKVLEWEESPDRIVKTLEESGGKQYSEFEILTKFHPNINERIQVLKNNLSLFVPSLWVAFAVGLFYGLIEFYSLFFKSAIFSDTFWIAATGSGEYQPPLDIGFMAFISIFIFTILMLAVSSGFHKSILKDTFIDNTGYFSTAKILNIIKFSLAFSLGWVTIPLIGFPTVVYRADVDLLGDFLDVVIGWIYQAIYFSISLIFLLIFATMLIRRSFSKKDAEKNFLLITVFSSILYIINRFVAIEILHNKPLLIVFFLIFSVVTYAFIKIKDRRLCCPNCNSKISNLSGLNLNCPNCHFNLYSWAVYSFSKNSVG
jgi:Zn-dependent protease with chaperone function